METQLTETVKKEFHSDIGSVAQIQELMDNLNSAASTKNLDKVMSFYAPEIVAYDLVKKLEYVGKDSYRKSWKEYFDISGNMKCESKDLKISADESLAFCHSLNHYTGTMSNGEKTDMWMRSTICFTKLNGKWFIVHEHLSEPVDFENGKILSDLKPEESVIKH